MKAVLFCCAAPFALIATSVSATVYDFSVVNTFQGNATTSGSYVPDFQFSIDDATGVPDVFSVEFDNIFTTGQRPYLGVPAGDVTYTVNYTFDVGTGTTGGGFTDATGGQTFATHSYFGPQLFGGSTFAPHFIPGVYKLYFSEGYTPLTPADAILTITGPGGAGGVPEPGTWMMMVLGFAVVGGTLRHRVRTSRVEPA